MITGKICFVPYANNDEARYLYHQCQCQAARAGWKLTETGGEGGQLGPAAGTGHQGGGSSLAAGRGIGQRLSITGHLLLASYCAAHVGSILGRTIFVIFSKTVTFS